MTALLIWPLVGNEAPRLITSDYEVIDLLKCNPAIWQKHISSENRQRILGQISRWEVAVQSGASAIDAFAYAIDSDVSDFTE